MSCYFLFLEYTNRNDFSLNFAVAPPAPSRKERSSLRFDIVGRALLRLPILPEWRELRQRGHLRLLGRAFAVQEIGDRIS